MTGGGKYGITPRFTGCLTGLTVLCALVVCAGRVEGQRAVYILHNPTDMSFGVRVDLYPLMLSVAKSDSIGIYSSVSYGNGGLYGQYGLDHHIRAGGGFLIPLSRVNGWLYELSFGMSYHHLGRGYHRTQQVKGILYDHWSSELGIAAKMKRMTIYCGVDPLRWEAMIGLGVVF